MRLSQVLPIVVVAVLACKEPPPPPPVLAVAPTGDTVVVSAVSVPTAEPRSDGSWVILAAEEGEVRIVDFAQHRVIPFPGMTTAEVPHPSVLLGLGDTTVVGDWGLRRFTSWLPGAPRLEAWPVPDALRGAFPHARDAAGQWYFEVPPVAQRDGSGLRDSAAVVRADAQLTRFDTIARLAAPDLAIVPGADGPRYERRLLAGQDLWGVQRNGTFWIARVFQNRIEWHYPNAKKPFTGPAMQDPILPVQEMDRQIFIRRFPEDQREAARRLQFTAIKPPFEGAFQTPDQRVWLFKSAVALDSVRRFQVVDSTGVRVVVTVPSRGSALGVDSHYILMAEEFPGGIRLLRYPVPEQAKGTP
ncbi:MAG: hypothetical protein ABJC19_06860 [Gemmatimonadota bacterium]